MEIEQTGQAAGGAAPTPGTPPPAAAPAPITPAPAAAAPAPIPPGNTWTSGLNDDFKAYVDTKGFKDPAQVLDSYRNLEKLMGAPRDRLVKLPEKSDDAAWGDVYKQLGRPDKPEDYGFKPQDGQAGSKEITEWASKSFHELGLNKTQAEKLIGKWNEFQTAGTTAQQEAKKAALAQEHTALAKEWGAAVDVNREVARSAAKEFGLDEATLGKMADVLGFHRTMTLLHSIGSKVGEPKFETGDNKGGYRGPMTPAAAQARIAELKTDKAYMERYGKGEIKERDEFGKLHEWAYGQR